MLSSAISYRRRRKVSVATTTLISARQVRDTLVAEASGLEWGRV